MTTDLFNKDDLDDLNDMDDSEQYCPDYNTSPRAFRRSCQRWLDEFKAELLGDSEDG